MNMQILNQIVALVASLPAQRMNLAQITFDQPGECGTVACALGHAAHNGIGGLSLPNVGAYLDFHGTRMWWHTAAAEALECSIDDAILLFGTAGEAGYDSQLPDMTDKQLFLARVQMYLEEHPELQPQYVEPTEPHLVPPTATAQGV